MAYNNNNIVVLDFETGSRNPYLTQPIQLASIMIDGKKLEMIAGSEFNTEIKPIIDNEELQKSGLEAITEEALKVNKKDLEKLKSAKCIDVVWNEFQTYLKDYKTSKSDSGNPILAGFNNNRFDDIILQRLAKEYGGFDKEKCKFTIFHPRLNIDLYKIVWLWFENSDVKSLSLDSLRELFGMSSENAHDALQDVKDTAELIVRFLRLSRHLYPKIKFSGSCKERIVK